MATFATQVQNNQILFAVCVSKVPNQEKDLLTYQALFDTGAQMTMISEKVVQEVGLQPISDIDITPVSGKPIKTESYMARLDIPIAQNVVLPDGKVDSQPNLFGKEIEVAKLPYDPVNYDVLLGMDFIGLFHITMWGKIFILSN